MNRVSESEQQEGDDGQPTGLVRGSSSLDDEQIDGDAADQGRAASASDKRANAVEPVAAEPGTAEPDAAEAGTTEPAAAELGTAKPEAAEPDAAEPGTAKPDATELGTVEPGTAKPDAVKPGMAEQNLAESGAAEPGTAAPGATRPDAAEPNVVRGPDAVLTAVDDERRQRRQEDPVERSRADPGNKPNSADGPMATGESGGDGTTGGRSGSAATEQEKAVAPPDEVDADAEYRLTMIQSVREAVNRICEQAVEKTAAIVKSGSGGGGGGDRQSRGDVQKWVGAQNTRDAAADADSEVSEFSLPPPPPPPPPAVAGADPVSGLEIFVI